MQPKFVAIFAAGLLALGLSACETMQPATYSNYGDNTFELRKIEGVKVRIGSITDQSKFDSNCRLVGPIKTSGNRPIAEFVKDSFNDELKFAGLYSDDPSTVNLAATLQSASFSSMEALTQGHWDFSLQLANPANGKTIVANSSYSFDSGFVADIACANVSNALTPAVQRLIHTAISNTEFRALIGK
ncbi:MAG TPA: hypothetical protein VMS78_07520 [Rhizomicrobium sp.]|nr:hypothetical protein [Rhizomicrobium sp.]